MGAFSSTSSNAHHSSSSSPNVYDSFTNACRTKNIDELAQILHQSDFYDYCSQGRQHARSHDPPLIVGARYGDAQVMRLLMSRFSAEKDHDTNGMTPLIVASKFCSHGAIQVLLEHHADVNYVSSTGNTALTMAIKTDLALHVVNTLCKGILFTNKKPITKWKNQKFTELINARRLGVVRQLLEHRADVLKVDGEGLNALLSACKYGRCDVLRYILQHEVYADGQFFRTSARTAQLVTHVTATATATETTSQQADVMVAATETNAPVTDVTDVTVPEDPPAQLLHPVSVDVTSHEHPAASSVTVDSTSNREFIPPSQNNDNTSPRSIHSTVSSSATNLTAPTNITNAYDTNDGSTALIFALEMGRTNVMKLLMDHGADASFVHPQDGTLLGMACERQKLDVVFLLLGIEDPLSDCPSPGKRKSQKPFRRFSLSSFTPFSSTSNATPLTPRPPSKPLVDINQQDSRGRTALMRAAWSGWLTGVSFLLYSGADPNITDRQSNTALFYLFEGLKYRVQPQRSFGKYQLNHDTLRIFDLLKDAGADINHSNRAGANVLVRACETVQNTSILRYLLNLVTITAHHWRKCVSIAKKKTSKDTLQALLACTPALVQQPGLSDTEKHEVYAMALWNAVEYNMLPICRIILPLRIFAGLPELASPDDMPEHIGATVLMLAANKGHTQLIDILLTYVVRACAAAASADGADDAEWDQHMVEAAAREARREEDEQGMMELSPREPLFEYEDESGDDHPLLMQYEL